MTSHRKPRSVGLGLAAILIASSLLGCSLLKKKLQGADAGEDDDEIAVVDAAIVTPAGIGAKNEADVLRYANETPVANEPAVIGSKGAKARNFPGNGPEVANLAPGTNVTKVAQYFSTATLVMFDDPEGGGKLLGWVSPKAFDVTEPTPKATTTPTSAPTPSPTKDKDPAPSRVVDAGSTPTPTKDAGAAIPDAGSSAAAKDAGAPPKPAPDAGGGGGGGGGASNSTIPQPPRGVLAVPPTNGKCPDGWAVAESMCRRKCAADAECPRGTKCASKQGVKVCTSDH